MQEKLIMSIKSRIITNNGEPFMEKTFLKRSLKTLAFVYWFGVIFVLLLYAYDERFSQIPSWLVVLCLFVGVYLGIWTYRKSQKV